MGIPQVDCRLAFVDIVRTQRGQEQAKQGKEGKVSAWQSTPTRWGELRRAIVVARRPTTSVERAHRLTAAMANTAVALVRKWPAETAGGERRSFGQQ